VGKNLALLQAEASLVCWSLHMCQMCIGIGCTVSFSMKHNKDITKPPKFSSGGKNAPAGVNSLFRGEIEPDFQNLNFVPAKIKKNKTTSDAGGFFRIRDRSWYFSYNLTVNSLPS
ncbi:MAG: hypothetical protein JW801_09130, partial [Bacteroidales bacterium]|nr:hypothetical protein [Bacteroidales bacterium]